MQAIDTQPGPQSVAAESTADIVIFGGAAGGGKSFWLLLECLKYYWLSGYEAVIIRRTSTQLVGAGSIWEESRPIYSRLKGVSTESPHRKWAFPSGAKIWASHCQHEKDLEGQHQGKQYACVALDELTQFTEPMFWYFYNRMRTRCGIRPTLRATCNPDPDSFVARLIDWWLDENGDPIPERSGVVRWMTRSGEDIVWGDTAEELVAHVEVPPNSPDSFDPLSVINSFTFVSSKVTDNQKLLDADPGYYGRLLMLPPVEQARYLHGNWKTRPAAGDFFQRGWFRQLADTEALARLRRDPTPDLYTKRLRIYDLASTPVRGCLVPDVKRPEGFAPRPEGYEPADWSASLLVCEARAPAGVQGQDPKYVLEDLQRYKDTPGALREWIKRQAKIDGPSTRVAFFVDPGQAGVDQIEQYKKDLRGLARVLELPTKAGPRDYSGTPAKQRNALIASRAAYNGQVYYRAHPDMHLFFNELEAFPDKHVHDDWVDTLSGAIRGMLELPSYAFEYTEVKPLPLETQDTRDGLDDEEDTRVGGTAGFERGF